MVAVHSVDVMNTTSHEDRPARSNAAAPATACSDAALPGEAPTAPRLSTAWWGIVVRAIVAFLIVVAANQGVALISTPLAAAAGDDPVVQVVILVAGFALVGAVMVALVWAWMRLVERRPMRTAGWRLSWGQLGWLGVGTLASVVVTAAIVGVGMLLPMPEGAPAGSDESADALPLWLTIAFVLVRSYLLQGIPEELVYRGWLFSTTQGRPLLTLTWTTVAFTVIHLTSSGGQQNALDHVLYLAIPLGFAALAGALVLLTGSMWVAAGVHGGFHLSLALVAPLLPGAGTSADWVLVGAGYLVAATIVLAIWNVRRQRGAAQRLLDGSVA